MKRFFSQNPQLPLNIFLLIISCVFIIYLFVNTVTNVFALILMLFIGIAVELIFNYLLAFAKLAWKNKKITSWIYYLFCGVYIICFALPSSIGFYTSELSLKEKQYSKQILINKESENDIIEINSQIKTLVIMLSNELTIGDGIIGKRSREISSNIIILRQQKYDMLNNNDKIITEREPAFVGIARALTFIGITAGQIILIMFTAAMILIYIGLILTSWNLVENLHTDATESPTINKTKELRHIEAKKAVNFYDMK